MFEQLFIAFTISLGAMFPLINPIGHAPMFFVMTQGDSIPFRHEMARKSAMWTFLILCVSLLTGEYILKFFGIGLDDLRIGGGLLIAHSAWGMLTNTNRISPSEHAAAVDKEDISLTPMATPILAGPGAMSLAIGLIAYGSTPADYAGYLLGFAAIALLTWVTFYFSDRISSFMSVNSVGAMNRILGFFILGIGVNLMVDGVKNSFFLKG